MLGIYAVIGQRYEPGPICAAVLVPTKVVSFVTITTVIWIDRPPWIDYGRS